MAQRLIDANALKGFLRESYNSLKKIYDGLEYNEDRAICGGQLSTFLEAILMVNEAPTVDAVPVVRCGECVHKRLLNKEEMRFYGSDVLACTRQRTYNDPLVEVNHFCAYGERRDSNG